MQNATHTLADDKKVMPANWPGELKAILALGLPMAATQLVQFLVYTIDVVMIARVVYGARFDIFWTRSGDVKNGGRICTDAKLWHAFRARRHVFAQFSGSTGQDHDSACPGDYLNLP